MRENITSGIKFGAKKIKIYAECIYIQHSAKRTTVTVPSNFCDGGRPLWFFAEGNSLPSVFLNFCRAHFFAECFSTFLPSVFLCRVFFCFFAERTFFPGCFSISLLSVLFCRACFARILGKERLCRAPAKILSPKSSTLGKVLFSRSVDILSSCFGILRSPYAICTTRQLIVIHTKRLVELPPH